ncbi:MAG: hypothetical protein OXP75_17740 [Rhodospirillales bacterium]|nr:hypothetical protein [Rhodospirillales bacterium]
MPGNPQTAARFSPPKAQGVATPRTSRRPVCPSRRTLAEIRSTGNRTVRGTPLDSEGKSVIAFDLASRIRGISAKKRARAEPLAVVDPEDSSVAGRLDAGVAGDTRVDTSAWADKPLGRGGEGAGPTEPASPRAEPFDSAAPDEKASSATGETAGESEDFDDHDDDTGRVGVYLLPAKRSLEAEQSDDVRGSPFAPARDMGDPDLADDRDRESADRDEPPDGDDASSDTTSVLDLYAGPSVGQSPHAESLDAPASEPDDAERPEFGNAFDLAHPLQPTAAAPRTRSVTPADPGPGPVHELGVEARDDRSGLADLPLAAIAFATDPDTEHTLCESLQDRNLPFSGCQEPQIRHGDLRAAINALSKSRSVKLAIVDIDGSPYPVGALHEMAGICEVGTIVIAVGSTDSAKLGRELLIAGVSDYLVKPITVNAVLDAIDHAIAPEEDSRSSGTVAGFVGTGGSGSTTLAAAVAIDAARQGRYVSVLDLNRTVAAAAVALDVEPPTGLDQLFELAAHGSADVEIVDRVKVSRSDRIAVYAYGQNAVLPAIPDVSAIDWLVAQLSLRSQLVVVDGFDDPVSCIDVLARVDTPVLVYEPANTDSRRAARMLDLLRDHPAVVLVENCARSIRRKKRAHPADEVGPERQPDVVVPYEQSLPEISNRGWPEGRMPRSLRKPLDSLVGRIIAPPVEGEPALSQSARRA